MQNHSIPYRNAGVDLRAADNLVKRIKTLATQTFTKGVVRDIGLFGGLFKLDLNDVRSPVLVSSADGVGTKLKLAFAMDRHNTVGIDLVGMNVNDIVVHGAKPLFFMDYFASGKLDVDRAEQVVTGITEGCKQAGCALLGGETAELPGFYAPGEYELSGFCVGIVDHAGIIDGSSIGKGNQLIGLASSGLHSNGFSLVRKILDEGGFNLQEKMPGTDRRLGEILLEPTRIYVKSVLNVLRDLSVNGMVHITGGGFYDNVPRILPNGVQAHIDFKSWPKPPVYDWLRQSGNLTWQEMLQIFNCGIGLIMVVDKRQSEDILLRLQGLKEQAWIIGEIRPRKEGQDQIEIS